MRTLTVASAELISKPLSFVNMVSTAIQNCQTNSGQQYVVISVSKCFSSRLQVSQVMGPSFSAPKLICCYVFTFDELYPYLLLGLTVWVLPEVCFPMLAQLPLKWNKSCRTPQACLWQCSETFVLKKSPVGSVLKMTTMSATLCPAIIVPFLWEPTCLTSSNTWNRPAGSCDCRGTMTTKLKIASLHRLKQINWRFVEDFVELTAASKDPGATTRFSKTFWIFVTKLKTEACSCADGVKSWFLFSKACSIWNVYQLHCQKKQEHWRAQDPRLLWAFQTHTLWSPWSMQAQSLKHSMVLTPRLDGGFLPHQFCAHKAWRQSIHWDIASRNTQTQMQLTSLKALSSAVCLARGYMDSHCNTNTTRILCTRRKTPPSLFWHPRKGEAWCQVMSTSSKLYEENGSVFRQKPHFNFCVSPKRQCALHEHATSSKSHLNKVKRNMRDESSISEIYNWEILVDIFASHKFVARCSCARLYLVRNSTKSQNTCSADGNFAVNPSLFKMNKLLDAVHVLSVWCPQDYLKTWHRNTGETKLTEIQVWKSAALVALGHLDPAAFLVLASCCPWSQNYKSATRSTSHSHKIISGQRSQSELVFCFPAQKCLQ